MISMFKSLDIPDAGARVPVVGNEEIHEDAVEMPDLVVDLLPGVS